MATTTNFGWETPDDTDLVKDGALAMRTLGNAIDASLVDLKGGTTGQVLSKTSNTDMDFTWVTSDDANAIQNAIVDAKGDLIAASADNTPARLAVGTNGTFLTPDSSQATGLKWATAAEQFPWSAYTTTTGGITLGNGSLAARYQQIGKTVNFEILFTLGSTSAVTGQPTFSLPAGLSAKINGYTLVAMTSLGDYGVGVYPALSITPTGTGIYVTPIQANGTYAVESSTSISATVPFTWTTNDYISIRGTYEAA